MIKKVIKRKIRANSKSNRKIFELCSDFSRRFSPSLFFILLRNTHQINWIIDPWIATALNFIDSKVVMTFINVGWKIKSSCHFRSRDTSISFLCEALISSVYFSEK